MRFGFRMFSIVLLLLAWLGSLHWGCAPGTPKVRACQDATDCLAGESCVKGFCSSPSFEGLAEGGKEEVLDAGKERGPEVFPGEEPQMLEPKPEPTFEKTPVEESLEKKGCGSGSSCKPEQICLEGACVSRVCGPCASGGATCGKELCLRNSRTNESFCGRKCVDNGSCPPGFTCLNIGGQLGKQCVPPGATCKAPLGLGGKCRGGSDPTCPHHFPYCSSAQPGKEGRCTSSCKSLADCPAGFKRCADRGDGVRVCLPGCQSAEECPLGSRLCRDDGSGAKTCQKGCRDHRDCSALQPFCKGETGQKECKPAAISFGPEFCGSGKANGKGVGGSCPKGVGDCSGSANLCLGKGVSPLQPFCSKACLSDADCGDGAFCREVKSSAGTQKVCLPQNCLCLASPAVGSGQKDLMAEALKAINHTRCSLIFNSKEIKAIPGLIANDPFRLSFFNRLHREPLQLVSWGKGVVKEVDSTLNQPGVGAIAANIANASKWLDAPVKKQPLSFTSPAQDPLAAAVAQLIQDQGGVADRAAIQKDAADVPKALQVKIARIVLAMSAAATLRKSAFPPSVAQRLRYFFDRAQSLTVIGSRSTFKFGSPAKPSADYWVLAKDFGYQKMYQGAWVLADAIAKSELKPDTSYRGFSFSQNTPLGRIVVMDNADHRYASNDPKYSGPIALLVDTGGNDTYHIQAGANLSERNGVSVLIDMGGNDRYGYEVVKHSHDKDNRFPSDQDGRYNPPTYCEKDSNCGFGTGPCVNRACQRRCSPSRPCPSGAGKCNAKGYCSVLVRSYGPISLSMRNRQGGARLGLAFLIDMGSGKDTYQSLRMSQGFAALGVGVLYDGGGDDLYQCESGCQGSAAFGIGLLIDRGGSDTYLTYNNAQGFAYARAAGILLDEKGNDKYLADHGDPKQDFRGKKGDPLYLSAQLPGQGNSAFVQGAAFGRRADFSDNLFMSGGLAILRDRSGDDEYTAGVFGQGTGFWYGTGILADGAGKDKYDGLWYVQGATAHYAMSLFLESGGDDQYNSRVAPRATHLGVGHDYSISWLIDDSGNDTYRGGGLTLGAGNDNGFGFLIDNGGDDLYAPGSTNSLGRANSPNPDTNARNTQGLRTLGVFLDAGGQDVYKRSDGTKILGNNKLWSQGRSAANSARRKLEHGVGVDGKGTSTITSK